MARPSEGRLAEIQARETFEWTLTSGCSDYACYCHADAKGLVDEVRRLRRLLCAVVDPTRPNSEVEAAIAEVESIRAEAREERGK